MQNLLFGSDPYRKDMPYAFLASGSLSMASFSSCVKMTGCLLDCDGHIFAYAPLDSSIKIVVLILSLLKNMVPLFLSVLMPPLNRSISSSSSSSSSKERFLLLLQSSLLLFHLRLWMCHRHHLHRLRRFQRIYNYCHRLL